MWVWAAGDLGFVQKLFAGCVSSGQNIDSLARPYFTHYSRSCSAPTLDCFCSGDD